MFRLSLFLVTVFALVAIAVADPYQSFKCGTGDKLEVTETEVLGRIDPGDDKDVIFIKPDDQHVFARTSEHILYHSSDGGKTWNNENSRLRNSDVPNGVSSQKGVQAIYPTANHDRIFFLGYGGFYWTTANKGVSYQFHSQTSMNILSITPHPVKGDWALAYTATEGCYNGRPGDCHYDLYYTHDFGVTWNIVTKYVGSFAWAVSGLNHGNSITNDTIVLTTFDRKSGSQSYSREYEIQLVITHDYFKTSPRILQQHAPGLILHQNVFFTAVYTDSTLQSLSLLVSYNGGSTFEKCTFNREEHFEENRYSILDVNNGVIVVNVDHSDFGLDWGNIYISQPSIPVFKLSLRHNKRWFGTTDFTKAHGLDGIYLANVYESRRGAEPTEDLAYTVISHNKGGSWERIPAPAGSKCQPGECYLNLNGPGESTYGRFYTDEDAVGLIMATGNIGRHLSDKHSDTYFSPDAGLTWWQSSVGSDTYEFADRGGFILSAPYITDTTNITYSINQGKNWLDCKYGDSPYQVLDILADPDLSAHGLLMLTRRGPSKNYLVYVGFGKVFDRNCVLSNTTASDYELFVPRASNTSDCLMGARTAYYRRKPDVECFNTLNSTIKSKARCPCVRQDYECDTCFYRNITDHTCRFAHWECKENSYNKPPSWCNAPSTYVKTKGYRLVPNNMCDPQHADSIKGLHGETVECPTKFERMGLVGKLFTGLFVVVFIFVILSGTFFVLVRTHLGFREWAARTFPSIVPAVSLTGGLESGSVYSQLPRPDSMDDDEDAFGNEAKELDDDTIINYRARDHSSRDEFDPRS